MTTNCGVCAMKCVGVVTDHEPVEVEPQQYPEHDVEEKVEWHWHWRRVVEDGVAGGV